MKLVQLFILNQIHVDWLVFNQYFIIPVYVKSNSMINKPHTKYILALFAFSGIFLVNLVRFQISYLVESYRMVYFLNIAHPLDLPFKNPFPLKINYF